MTYVFIVNPHAGRKENVQKTLTQLRSFCETAGHKSLFFITDSKGNATKLAKYAAEKYAPVRIYACGGDGTLNETLQGIVGYDNVEFGCIPIGSGNDFVKSFPNMDFMDFKAQIASASQPIDLISSQGEYGQRYSINALSLSWDSRVAMSKNRFVKWPLVNGKNSYFLAVLYELVKKQPTEFSVELDGEIIDSREYMIGICANGAFYGGGFMGAPKASLQDGVFDLVLIKSISRIQVAKLFPKFKNGEHVEENGLFDEVLTYKQGKKLELHSEAPIPITIDGEEFYSKSLSCRILENKIKLIIPAPDNA